MKIKKNIFINDISNGLDYKTIAEIMTSNGDKMNHSSVRNYVLRSFMKIAKHISDMYELNHNDEKIFEIAKSYEFQMSIINLMQEIYDEENRL